MSKTRQNTPVLGELEFAVMDFLWREGQGDVRAAHQAVGARRNITSNTVQSTLKRLHDKGLARRDKVSHAFVYTPACTREGFHSRVLDQVVGGLMHGQPDAVLAAFVDLAEAAGPEQLERLEALVQARMRDGEVNP